MTDDPRAEALQAMQPLVPVDKARLMQGAFSPTKAPFESPELPQLPTPLAPDERTRRIADAFQEDKARADAATKMLPGMALSGTGAALGAMGGGYGGAMYGGLVGYGLSTLAGFEQPSWTGAAVNTLAPYTLTALTERPGRLIYLTSMQRAERAPCATLTG